MKLLLFLILASVFVSSISLSYAEEITPKYPIMKNFPYDSQKGVGYYLERYYSDSVYKTWFHANFPGTIEEAVGLVKSYDAIKETLDGCKDEGREAYDKYMRDIMYSESARIDPILVFERAEKFCIDTSGVRQLNNAGVILFDLGFYRESIVLYDSVIELYPEHETAQINKDTSLSELGESKESTVTMQTTPTGIICGTGTIYKDGQCIVDHSTSKSLFSKGGGCLIATATYGSELAPQVQQLRELRDNSLLQTESGTSFMNYFNDFYYSFSPYIADYERENPLFKEMVKIAITPMISSLSILNYVDMNSEAEVFGYGISLIVLNVGMYIGIPAAVIIGIKRKLN